MCGSVPSGREWADALGKQCGAGGAQVIALGMGVDRQRHRRIVAVPGRDDVHWHAAGQHKADAGITEALEVDAAQAGLLTQALEFVGVPLMADGGAVLAYRDQTVIGPARAESLCFGLLAISRKPSSTTVAQTPSAAAIRLTLRNGLRTQALEVQAG